MASCRVPVPAHDRVLRPLPIAWLVFISGMGMSMVADAPIAESFDAGAIGFGFLITAGAAALPSARSRDEDDPKTEPPWLVVAAGVIAATASASASRRGSPWVVRMMLVMGPADGLTIVGETDLRQRRAPDAVRSRASAAFTGVMHLMLAFAYIVAAFVVPWIGSHPVLLAAV